MQGNESVRTKDRQKKTAEIERLHEKTFRAWANSQLRVRDIKIETNLAESFHDGLTLIQLVEILSKKKCTGKYHKNPEKDIHKLENITIAIEFLKEFVQVNISSNDILKGNLKVILGVVWRLILTFQVEGQETDETAGMSAAQRNKLAKQKLLKWCQDTTAGHNHVNIQDFQDSWFDGMAFCALVHAMDPSIIDYDSLSPNNARANLALAFSLAEKHFDIPQLLDPDDITNADPQSRPDEQCFITYLSAFPVAMLQNKIGQNNDAKIKEAEDAARRAAEEEALRRIKEAEDAARRAAEEEAARKAAELEAKLRADDEERRRLEAQRIKEAELAAATEAENRAKAKAEKEARKRAKQDEMRKREAEMDEAKRLAEEEARERAFEEERKRLEEENRKLKESLNAAKAKLIGKLKVTVIQARGLPNKVDGYCALFLERQKEKTRTVKKTKEPKWNAEFEFYVSERDATVEITLFHRNWIFSDDFLGFVTIPVAELPDGEEVNEWYELKSRSKKEKNKEKDKHRGELKLRLLYQLEN